MIYSSTNEPYNLYTQLQQGNFLTKIQMNLQDCGSGLITKILKGEFITKIQ